MIDAGVDVAYLNGGKQSCLTTLAYNSFTPEIWKLLLDAGARKVINVASEGGMTPFGNYIDLMREGEEHFERN